MSAFPFSFASEGMGHEFAIISDFLASWDGNQLEQQHPNQDTDATTSAATLLELHYDDHHLTGGGSNNGGFNASTSNSGWRPPPNPSTDPKLKLSSTERFILTAADPSQAGSAEDRLHSIISAKIDAGLLKPHNYVNGYTNLQRWMEGTMSQPSRKRILSVLGTFRPTFRYVAQSLTDYDLVMVEEAFE
ncbi:hypothetical protein HKX48_000345, partial [Thoreauomyces humboldtii]